MLPDLTANVHSALLDFLLLPGAVHVFDWGCHAAIFIIAFVDAVHFPLLAVTQGVDGVFEVLFHVSRYAVLHFGGWNGEKDVKLNLTINSVALEQE